jgi:hypothetical protein
VLSIVAVTNANAASLASRSFRPVRAISYSHTFVIAVPMTPRNVA